MIGTKLQAYFPETAIPTEWTEFSALVTGFYALEGIASKERFSFAADLAQRLGVASVNQSPQGWLALRNRILERKAALIQQVLREEVSVLG